MNGDQDMSDLKKQDLVEAINYLVTNLPLGKETLQRWKDMRTSDGINNKLSECVQKAIQVSKEPLDPKTLQDFLINDVLDKKHKDYLTVIKTYTTDIDGIQKQLKHIIDSIKCHEEYMKEQKKIDKALLTKLKKVNESISKACGKGRQNEFFGKSQNVGECSKQNSTKQNNTEVSITTRKRKREESNNLEGNKNTNLQGNKRTKLNSAEDATHLRQSSSLYSFRNQRMEPASEDSDTSQRQQIEPMSTDSERSSSHLTEPMENLCLDSEMSIDGSSESSPETAFITPKPGTSTDLHDSRYGGGNKKEETLLENNIFPGRNRNNRTKSKKRGSKSYAKIVSKEGPIKNKKHFSV